MSDFYMPVSAALISILLLVVYCTKEKVKIKENDIYLVMLVCILLDSLLISYIFVSSNHVMRTKILNKCEYMVLVTWSACLCKYTHAVIHKKDKKHEKIHAVIQRIFTILVACEYLLIWCFRLDAECEGEMVKTITGPAAIFTFSCCAVHLLLCLVIILCNIRKVNKRVVPVFAFFGIAALSALTYYIDPSITGVSMGLAIVNLTMYFTIENPDVQMLEQVNLAKEQAQRASRYKTDFLSTMSHELRTPMNAIVGLAECIQNADTLAAAKEDAKDIVSASENLLEIINGILDISKIEAGKVEIAEKKYDLVDMTENLFKLVKTRVGEKPIEMNLTFSPNIPGVLYGDEMKIRQIMTNLLTNAIKYTDSGRIDFLINCTNVASEAHLTITVSDTGHGIKPEMMDFLFDRFKRLETSRNAGVEGTGLGLAISKQLVDMMGGTIEVHSVYGEGSAFTVKLTQRILSMERRETEKVKRVAQKYPNRHVLVVDDIEINRVVAKRLLELYEIEVELASSGAECIEKCKRKDYDLILLDDMMPKMSGTVTRRILSQMPGMKTPIVAFTANAIDGMREQYLSEGYADYISKPIESDELRRILSAFLK